MNGLTSQETPIVIDGGGVELRLKEIGGGMSVSFVRLAKGTDLGPAVQGLPDDLCPCPHWGYVLSGRLQMRTKTGEETYEAGQAVYWGPGHAPVALEDTEYVDFSPTEEFSKVIDHVLSQSS